VIFPLGVEFVVDFQQNKKRRKPRKCHSRSERIIPESNQERFLSFPPFSFFYKKAPRAVDRSVPRSVLAAAAVVGLVVVFIGNAVSMGFEAVGSLGFPRRSRFTSPTTGNALSEGYSESRLTPQVSPPRMCGIGVLFHQEKSGLAYFYFFSYKNTNFA